MAFKAWSYSTPGYPACLSLNPIDLPHPPKENEVHVRVQAAALNPADIQLMNLPIWYIPGLRYQKGIGADFAGEVIAVGFAVKKWKTGDQVWGFAMRIGGRYGTVAEVLELDTTKSVVLRRPENLSVTDAASIPLVFMTAYTTLVEYAELSDPPKSSPSILVLGGSTGCGIYALQIAKMRLHCHIVATASTRNIDFVKSLGADEVIDYTQGPILPGAIAHLPSNGGYDAIIDLVGGTELMPHLSTLLKPEAAYITIVGDKTARLSVGGPAIYPLFPRMMWRTLLGYLGYARKYYCISLSKKEEYLQSIVPSWSVTDGSRAGHVG